MSSYKIPTTLPQLAKNERVVYNWGMSTVEVERKLYDGAMTITATISRGVMGGFISPKDPDEIIDMAVELGGIDIYELLDSRVIEELEELVLSPEKDGGAWR